MRSARIPRLPCAAACAQLHRRRAPLANPDHIELLSFRRTFTLLILLVVVPSAGVSGFGVVAIVNERAAVEKRIEAVWATRVAAVSQGLRRALDGARLEGADPLRLTVDGLPLTDAPFTVVRGEVSAADPRLRAALGSVQAALGALPERPVAFSVLAPQGTWLLVALRQGEAVSGAVVSPYAVEQVLAAEGAKVTPAGEPARFALEPVQREAPEGVLARLVSGVSEVREALGPRELAGVALPAPLQDFRVVAFAQGEDPVAETSTRNRWLYGILLGVFYVTLAVGVIITGRTLYREARLSRMKTDFVSLVSHELRTPLTSIRMFIEMLALNRVKEPAEMQTVLDLLSTETARLSAMIESVLDWARIESGRKRYLRVRLTPRRSRRRR